MNKAIISAWLAAIGISVVLWVVIIWAIVQLVQWVTAG